MSDEPTMRLDEYIKQAEEDPNLFWRLQGGDHLNLLDEAIAEIERLRRAFRALEGALRAALTCLDCEAESLEERR